MAISENISAKLDTLRTAVNALNEVVAAGSDTKTLKDAVTKAVKEINSEVIAERVVALRAMPVDEMWDEYINHQFVPADSVKLDDETNRYNIITPADENHVNVRVSFPALNNDKDNNLARIPHWNTMLKVFCENLALFNSDAIGKQYVEINGDNSKLVEERKKMGPAWQPKTDGDQIFSKQDMEDMLNEVVFAIIPDSACKRMIRADYKYLSIALQSAKKRTEDIAGEIVQRSNKTMEEYLFTAIYHRKNGLPYKWQKPKEDEKAGKTTNTSHHPEQEGLPSEYLEQPDASEVKTIGMPAEEVATAEKKEPKAKKSVKKSK